MNRTVSLAWVALVSVRCYSATLYVDASRTDDSGDGSTWETAKRTLQAAVNLAAAGDTVVVTNGTYAPVSTAVTPLAIRSVNGAAATLINGQGTTRCLFLGYWNVNTVVSGFTLTNGYSFDGGGVYGGTVSNCVIAGNSAQWSGGGARESVLVNCTVSGNTASDGSGGGVLGGTLRNCALFDNTARWGGGGAAWATLINCTVAENAADSGGGAVWSTLNNCIVWNNANRRGELNNYDGGSFSHSCSSPLPEGSGNTDADPLLVGSEDGDLRFCAGSPCLDAGNNAVVTGDTDLAGAQRIQNGTVDMGAFEGAVTLSLAAPASVQATDGTFGHGVRVTWDVVPEAAYYRVYRASSLYGLKRAVSGWQTALAFEDASVMPERTYWYWVKASADAAGANAGRIGLPDSGWKMFAPDWYVDAARPDDSGDGHSWATAKRTLQAAVDLSSEGNAILVADGDYAEGFGVAEGGLLPNRLTVEKPLSLRSVNGPSATIIRGSGLDTFNTELAVRCAYLAEGEIVGFTFQDGATYANETAGDSLDMRGGGLYLENAVAKNCRIIGCRAVIGGGVYEGTLIACSVSDNSATSCGGGTCGSVVYDSLIERNISADGGGAFDGQLSHCRVIGNVALNSGGGMGDGELNDCVLSGNRAGTGGGCSSATLVNCTVAGNFAETDGGVVGSWLRNCIVWGNERDNWFDCSLSHSCSEPLPDGEGNICVDPLLVGVEDGDGRLLAGSPCLDAGDNGAVAGEFDLVNAPRIQNGIVDMGAYEGSELVPSLPAPQNVQATDGAYGDKIRIIWNAVSGASHYRVYRAASEDGIKVPVSGWQTGLVFDDPVRLSDKTYWYWVKASADADGRDKSLLGAPDSGMRAFAARWYVDASRPHDAGDGLSWATAKRTLQAAVNAADEGDAILVADGIYSEGGAVAPDGFLSNRVMIAKAVTVKSVSGAASTVIEGAGTEFFETEGAVRCVYLSKGVLSGFSLRGGATCGYSEFDHRGGGIFMTGLQDETEARNCVIEACRAYEGGGIYGGLASLCTVRNSRANRGGGAYRSGLDGCTLYANQADEMGGGACEAVLSDCTLYANLAVEAGGGTLNGTLTDCLLVENAANAGGGACGGALYRCGLYQNTSEDGGGGASESTLADCEIGNNTANFGGGVCWGELTRCSLSGNRATAGGGAGESTLTGCSLSGNRAAEEGGGAANCVLDTCTLDGNTADSLGGGSSYSTLHACRLTGNVAVAGAGAWDSVLNSCVVWDNEAVENGGGVVGGSLNNCTVVGNVAQWFGGAESATLNNCIVWGNVRADGVLDNYNSDCGVAFSCSQPLPEGEGNISGDPLFACIYDGDFRLLAGSLCLDVGNNDTVSEEMATDLAGNPRVQNGTVDMGALEGATALTLPAPANVQASDGTFTDKVRVAWDPVPEAAYYRVFRSDSEDGGWRPVGEWQVPPVFEDLTALPDKVYWYAVTAAADEAKLDKSPFSLSDTGWKAFAARWHVDASRPDDRGDGRSWATAKRTLQAAVDAAAAGDGILVTNGVYAEGGRVTPGAVLSNRLVVAKAVTVKSANGPAATVIQGPGVRWFDTGRAMRCVYLTEGLVDGFTLRGGATYGDGSRESAEDTSGGGIRVAGSNGAEIRNCVIESCRAFLGGGAAGCTLNACVVRGNSAGAGGGTYECLLKDCELLENTAEFGGGAYGSFLSDCLLSGNQAFDYGGGVACSALEDCTLSSNEALSAGGAGDCKLTRCLLIGNMAVYDGGGCNNIEMRFDLELSNCTFIGNRALDGSGGGVCYARLIDCSFERNVARHGGGGVYGGALERCILTENVASHGGGATESFLASCVLSDNQANEAGGGAENCTMTNCTVSANCAPYGGGLVGCSVLNSIVWGNIAQDVLSTNYEGCSFAYCCTVPLPEGDGNLEADPLFADAAMHDYRLRTGSPCLNAGLNELVVGDADVRGDPRFQAGTVDMGAYEGAVAGHVISVRIQGHGAVSSKLALVVSEGGTASLSALAGPAAFRYYLTNGVFASASPEFVWSGITTDGVLTAVFDSLVWHVDASRPDDSGDGLSWATAKRTLQAAVAEAWDGDTVLAADGRYGPVRTDNRAIAIRSVNGASGTEINGNDESRCADLGTLPGEVSTNTVLVGFTLRRGATDQSGGGAFGGTLFNCRFIGNVAGEAGGGAYGACLYNCELEQNWSWGAGGAGASVLVNCTVWNNYSQIHVGGVGDCTAVNCIVWDNYSGAGAANYNDTSVLAYSCSSSLPPGEGNIESDPLFVDVEAGDLRLRAGSLCVDAGTDEAVSGETDISGQPRVQGAAVDMGAYEGALEGHVIAVRVEGAGKITPNEAQGVAEGGQVTFEVVPTEIPFLYYLTNGVVASESPVFTWSGVTEDGVLTAVFDTTCWFVDAARPDNDGDGRSWATAKRTIRAALEATGWGDTVFVADGVYAPIYVYNGVTVRSVSGPERTVIDGGGAERCAGLEGTENRLVGFTLRNGWADSGAGAYGGTLIDCVLSGNRAEYSGGGSYACALAHCVVAGNVSLESGGGVFGGALTDCVVSNNTAMTGGGISDVEQATRCEIRDNVAQDMGGGASSSTLRDCTLSSNAAETGGGASYCVVYASRFDENVAGYGGGAYECEMAACELRGNTAEGYVYEEGFWEHGEGRGGGSYGGTLSNCALTGNQAADDGGGAYGGSLVNCTLSGNAAGYQGGGTCGGEVSHCWLTDNVARYGGGASGGDLDNCIVSGNKADEEGGGVYGGTLNQCTVVGNSATYGGGGVHAAYVYDSIVWDNAAADAATANYSSDCDFQYSCSAPLPSGEGNIEGAPLWVDPEGGDYRLRGASPCVDAGSGYYADSETDILGNSRWQGELPDMGACEGGVFGHIIAVRVQGRGSVYPPMAQGVSENGSAVFIAEPGQGAFLGFLTNGVFASASPTFMWRGITRDGTLTAVFETPVWHVDATRPDDSGNGLSWATAKRTLQAAVDAAGQGETVLVADGVYEPFSSYNKAVSVRSVNGAGATFIDGNGAERCATLGHALCQNKTVLAGVTLRNGYDSDTGGGVRGGTLLDCVLTNNVAGTGGGAGYSTLIGCKLVGNVTEDEGGGALGCELSGCTLADNIASMSEDETEGGGACECTLRNCLIVGNSVVGSGGGAADCSIIENCTIFGNVATEGGGVAGYGDTVIQNCVVWGNHALYGENIGSLWDEEAPVVVSSCTTPLFENGGNISADPLFVNPTKGCFQLALKSPCVDAGSNILVTSETDAAGQVRIIGGRVDMGAYEALPHGLAVNSSNLVWTSGGAAYWFGQAAVTADGEGAVQSGPIDDSQSAWLQAAAEGKGTLSFMWRVASESGRDFLRFYGDGVPGGAISGETAWQTVTLAVTNGGTHTFRWEYAKGKSGAAGMDAGWLDQVVWTPVRATVSAVASPSEGGGVTGGGSCAVGSSVTLVAVPNRGWRFERWEDGGTDARRTLAVPDAGIACTAFFVRNAIPLEDALDTASLTWGAAGDAGWSGWVLASAHDAEDAAQSAALGDLETSGVQTTVVGPGTLSFWWRVSSEEGYDYLDFALEGQTLNWLTGESGWQTVTLHVGEGAHTFTWLYAKDESSSGGEDAAWLDQVSWHPDASTLTGFARWADERGLSGDLAALFAADRNGDGVANGFEYAYGTNANGRATLLNIRMLGGRPVVETPARDPGSTNDVEVTVLGATNLLWGGWSLSVGPVLDTAGKPEGREWFEPKGGVPDGAFFKLRAVQK